MEPLILTLKPGASYKNFNPSESDTFIYCMSGQITLNLGKEIYQAQEEDVLYFKDEIIIVCQMNQTMKHEYLL